MAASIRAANVWADGRVKVLPAALANLRQGSTFQG